MSKDIWNEIEDVSSLNAVESVLQERSVADLSHLSAQEQLRILLSHVAKSNELPVVPEEGALLERLERSKESGEPLVIKFGIDPTGSEIHIGHMVPVLMLERFMRMGHKIIFIVGDFTAKIGDGSDRESARKALTDEEVAKNVETYKEQASKVIDVEKIDYRFNGEWLNDITSAQLIEISQKISASAMWQREDFQNRIKKGNSVTMAELLYPVFMGMDSVVLEPDIEVGGLDQYLNLMWCRELMKIHDLEPEVFVTVDLIPGTDGSVDSKGRIVKMSKSLNNYIAAGSDPKDMFGLTMAIPDEVMWIWFRELTEIFDEEIEMLKRGVDDGSLHPMELKKMLARLVVGRFNGWDSGVVNDAERFFGESTGLSKQEGIPEGADVVELELSISDVQVSPIASSLGISGSEFRRLVSQNGVKVLGDGGFESVSSDLNEAFDHISSVLESKGECVLRVGKRKYVRILII